MGARRKWSLFSTGAGKYSPTTLDFCPWNKEPGGLLFPWSFSQNGCLFSAGENDSCLLAREGQRPGCLGRNWDPGKGATCGMSSCLVALSSGHMNLSHGR